MVDAVGPRTVKNEGRPVPVAAPAAVPAPRGATDNGGRTAAAPTLGGVARTLAASPPVDAERVSRIKKAVADGTFPILPALVADRLIALKHEWKPHDPA